VDTKIFNELAYDLTQVAIDRSGGDVLDATAVLLAASLFCARHQYGDDARLVVTQLLDRWAPTTDAGPA
jgi:hypothetical protein